MRRALHPARGGGGSPGEAAEGHGNAGTGTSRFGWRLCPIEPVCKTISEVYIRGLRPSTPAVTMGRETCLGGEQRFREGASNLARGSTWTEEILKREVVTEQGKGELWGLS